MSLPWSHMPRRAGNAKAWAGYQSPQCHHGAVHITGPKLRDAVQQPREDKIRARMWRVRCGRFFREAAVLQDTFVMLVHDVRQCHGHRRLDVVSAVVVAQHLRQAVPAPGALPYLHECLAEPNQSTRGERLLLLRPLVERNGFLEALGLAPVVSQRQERHGATWVGPLRFLVPGLRLLGLQPREMAADLGIPGLLVMHVQEDGDGGRVHSKVRAQHLASAFPAAAVRSTKLGRESSELDCHLQVLIQRREAKELPHILRIAFQELPQLSRFRVFRSSRVLLFRPRVCERPRQHRTAGPALPDHALGVG
mmetsp:Transcript_101293/g.285606  ORF Transcript_101293/g.285606 Transcript_101293/m.285606 type:complete len:308 (-) Transcript_101293:216-1139(-)